jgi:hypothetical protein
MREDPVAESHSLIVLSADAEAISFLQRENAIAVMV